MAIYNLKLSNILFDWQLSMASFRFCETYLLHIRPFMVNKSVISPFLNGYTTGVSVPLSVSVSVSWSGEGLQETSEHQIVVFCIFRF